mgnify:CR=1 FL=1
MSSNVSNNLNNQSTTITIKKGLGITHALRDLVKANNLKMSDGFISAKEWKDTIAELRQIQKERKAANRKSIFRADRGGYKLLVYKNDKIEFTADEMARLYKKMGVEFNGNKPEDVAPKKGDDENKKVDDNKQKIEDNEPVQKYDEDDITVTGGSGTNSNKVTPAQPEKPKEKEVQNPADLTKTKETKETKETSQPEETKEVSYIEYDEGDISVSGGSSSASSGKTLNVDKVKTEPVNNNSVAETPYLPIKELAKGETIPTPVRNANDKRNNAESLGNGHIWEYMNGDLWLVDNISSEGMELSNPLSENRNTKISKYNDIELAYASTIHKSQGSEFSNVIVVLPDSFPAMLNRNLLYTAVTRARDRVIIIAQNNALNICIGNKMKRVRKTMLYHLLSNI